MTCLFLVHPLGGAGHKATFFHNPQRQCLLYLRLFLFFCCSFTAFCLYQGLCLIVHKISSRRESADVNLQFDAVQGQWLLVSSDTAEVLK